MLSTNVLIFPEARWAASWFLEAPAQELESLYLGILLVHILL